MQSFKIEVLFEALLDKYSFHININIQGVLTHSFVGVFHKQVSFTLILFVVLVLAK